MIQTPSLDKVKQRLQGLGGVCIYVLGGVYIARTRGVFNYMWVNRVYIAGVGGVHVLKSSVARCS